MAENIMSLLNKLSFQIVSQEVENYPKNNSLTRNEKYFQMCLNRLRKKGCDVLLNKACIQGPEDPCLTEYGGNWSPLILLSDYERELKNKKAGKYSDILRTSLEIIQDKNYDCSNELLKFLLLLKKPFVDSSLQSQTETAFSRSDFLLNMLDSFSHLTVDYTTDAVNATLSNKKALHYEESWTKNFDGGFELLGEYSKKNLCHMEKGSLNPLFVQKSALNRIQSQSSAFVLADFFTSKNQRQKSLLELCANTDENVLLDKLVDNPITHKLPDMNFQSRSSIRSGFLEKLSEDPSKKKTLLQKKKSQTVNSSECCSLMSEKSSAIELKRNSNCCHSFSILYEKSNNSQESTCINDENSFLSAHKSLDNCSKDIIIGLWEEQHELLKEFKPELETCFPKLRMISISDYIENVKYLLTGINNGTFSLDSEKKTFHMIYGTCLQDVTPESLYNFSKSFLDIGNSYVQLIAKVTEIGKNNFDLCKTVSQAFWKSIFDFLELHYTLVLEIPSNLNLMALKFSTMDMREMIMTVAEICKVSEPCSALPEGGQLLTYLLQVAEKLSKNCVRSLVFGLIQNCCNVYFMCILQPWMFQGSIDYDSSEFFINYKRPKMKTRTRCYYNSFYINSEKVPSFLEGFEENIFNCGKSIHFLKLFNIEDKFCQLLNKTDYPSMYPCLTQENLEKLRTEFEDYEKRAVEICGPSITIKTIRKERKEKEKKYFEYIKDCKRKEEEKRESERKIAAERMKAKKMEQTRQLNQCWKEIKEEKKRRKEALKIERLKAEAEREAKSKEMEVKIEEEVAVIGSYYGEQLEVLEKRLNLAETRKKSLIDILNTLEGEPTELPTNNKIQLDIENNITGSNLDINYDQQKMIWNKTEKDVENNITGIKMKSSDKTLKEIQEKSETDIENNIIEAQTELKVAQPEPQVEGGPKMDIENDITEDINCNTEQSLNAEKISLEMEGSGDSIFYDVNSNPNFTVDPNVSSEMRKCISFQSTAAEEAKRNKLKVLRSEFDIQSQSEPQLPTAVKREGGEIMTDLEKNRAKVMSSEYNVLNSSTINNKWSENMLKRSRSSINSPDEAFETINLRKKKECINLKSPSGSKEIIIQTFSLGSLQSEDKSGENVELVETPAQSSIILNEMYQKALARDAEISQNKIAQQNIFCSLKKEELTKPTCKDFMQFQRYLRKSVLIPLKIQEKLANDALLKQLLLNENLLSHLNSLRGYFFLNDGEFGRSFTHHTFRSLAKCTEPSQFFERSNLSNIVNEALNYTIHNDEPNAQNLSFQIIKMPPFLNHASHDVLSPFELSYRADWPLNIILTEKALSKYKMVFRFLLKLKRINWTLNENYLHLNSYFKTKKLDGKWFRSSHYHKIQIYRHAMTQVMITLDDYIFSNGIQCPWICFQKDLENTENIDHLYQKHVRYMKDVLTRCFLSKDSEDLLDCLHNLIEIALKFHYTTKSSNFELHEGKLSHPKYKVLKLTFAEFCTVIKTFLRMLKEKISTNQIAKSHYVLIEKFDIKLT